MSIFKELLPIAIDIIVEVAKEFAKSKK